MWDDNEIQFARLICELVANIDDLELDRVADSMDLTLDELSTLYDRAEMVWETAKEEAQDDD